MILKKYKQILFYLIMVLIIFLLDRVSKLYILNLAENSEILNVYISSYLNFYLIWNKGIGFGLLSFEQSIIYNSITFLIIIINVIIVIIIFKINNFTSYFYLLILGGSLGNLFNRLYYSAVPDFIDFHIGNHHWFIFNLADIFVSIGIFFLIISEIFVKKVDINES